MALEIHTVELRAKDSMSPVFKKVGASAQQSAREVADSFERAGESTRRFNVAAAVLGTTIGASVGILSDFSRAAAEDAAGQARLQQSVENTGKSYDEFSDAVDRAIKKGQEKAFSDDQTREALVRLNTVTNDTGKSIDQLGLVMDFARTRGISLADSANVIGKVMGGNVAILQRYGIVVEDGATATEALALIQARSAGQAEAYADSQLGQLDKMKDKWAELAETIGGSTGELQGFLMLMPGLTAGYSALAGVIASLGGLKMLGSLGAFGAGAAVAYLASDALINQGNTGSRSSFTAVNYGLYGAGSLINAVTPGNPIDTQKYMDTLASNAIEDVVKGLFYFSPTESVGNRQLYDRLLTAGIVTGEAPEGSKGDKFIESQFLSIQRKAGQQGLTTGQFVEGQLNGAGSNFVFDNVSGRWMDLGEYQIYQEARMKAARADTATGAIYGPAAPVQGTSTRPRGTGPGGQDIGYSASPRLDLAGPGGQPTGNSPFTSDSQPNYRATGRAVGYTAPTDSVQTSMASMGAQSVAIAENMTRALQAQFGAYAGLFDGIMSANDAQAAFSATQDSLSSEMGVYQAQASEWNSELNAQEAAYEILNKRKEEGTALTAEETKFMQQYAKATEIGTNAVEDSTVAAGIAAQNMLLNKDAMDTFKTSTGELTDTILLLIEALGGVPDEVRTQITLDGADEFERQLNNAIAQLNAADGQTATFWINTQQTGVSVGNPNGPSISPIEYRHGGVISAARHGRVIDGGYTLVGDGGQPELLTGGQGRMVIPGGATRAKMRNGGGGGDMHFNAPITVIANDPRTFANQMREYSVGGSRA